MYIYIYIYTYVYIYIYKYLHFEYVHFFWKIDLHSLWEIFPPTFLSTFCLQTFRLTGFVAAFGRRLWWSARNSTVQVLESLFYLKEHHVELPPPSLGLSKFLGSLKFDPVMFGSQQVGTTFDVWFQSWSFWFWIWGTFIWLNGQPLAWKVWKDGSLRAGNPWKNTEVWRIYSEKIHPKLKGGKSWRIDVEMGWLCRVRMFSFSALTFDTIFSSDAEKKYELLSENSLLEHPGRCIS